MHRSTLAPSPSPFTAVQSDPVTALSRRIGLPWQPTLEDNIGPVRQALEDEIVLVSESLSTVPSMHDGANVGDDESSFVSTTMTSRPFETWTVDLWTTVPPDFLDGDPRPPLRNAPDASELLMLFVFVCGLCMSCCLLVCSSPPTPRAPLPIDPTVGAKGTDVPNAVDEPTTIKNPGIVISTGKASVSTLSSPPFYPVTQFHSV